MDKTLLKTLKENDQDFEFYPTSNEIIEKIHDDIRSTFNYFRNGNLKILDIGAGDGNVLNTLQEMLSKPIENDRDNFTTTKFAIEKSMILIQKMEKDISIVGTDFYEQSLIDKQMDIIFCNPPYSDYEYWVEKILKESFASVIYLVIPKRWNKKEKLKNIIEKREGEVEVIHTFDFRESEHRQARVEVEVLKVKICVDTYYNSKKASDPFDLWFEENFKIDADKTKSYDYQTNQKKSERIRNEIVKGKNLVESLEELYQKDFQKLLNNYKFLENLDYGIFKELGIDLNTLKSGLKEKIEGLKNLYWKELFDNMDKITDKLTSSSREKLLSKLMSHTYMDFTASNVYGLLVFVVKHYNDYLDKQLMEVYEWMAEKKNIKLYKSNKRIIEDDWRYNKYNMSHYSLDYRLVLSNYNNFSGYSFEMINGLGKTAHDKLNDIITIAKNLGFSPRINSYQHSWEPGKKVLFKYNDGKEFMEVKCYKNGNIHIKFEKEFLKALNIEAARINKWVKSPEEVSEEIGYDLEEVNKYFKKFENSKLTYKSGLLKLTSS